MVYRRTERGLTLIELMLVVSIIGLLAVLAIPAFMKARMRAKTSGFVNDLRSLYGAFQQYALENGDFPPDVPPGVMPVGMAEYLPRRLDWTAETRIGGHWDWDRAELRGTALHRCYAGVSVWNPGRTTKQMELIDEKIDDGNLVTGGFYARSNGYIYVLEK